ncbi:MAG: CARDB domain-containing protein [Candidatus Thermoplasmatota archaeon]
MGNKTKATITLCVVALLIIWIGSTSFSSGYVGSSQENNRPRQKICLEDKPGLENFEVEIIEPQQGSEFEMGEEISVKYRIENTGEEEDTQNIEFTVFDGEREIVYEEGREVTLQPGVDIEMLFTWTTESPGNYEIQVSSEDDSAEVEIEVIVEEQAYFGVEITSYDEEVIEGHEVVIEYVVENRGTEEESQDIEFDIYDEDGRSIFSESENILLSPGDNFTGEFTWENEENETGVFDVFLESDDDLEEVSVTVLEGAYFEVNIYEYDEEVVEGEEVSVTYRIDNTGEVEGEQDIEFIVEGEVVENETRVKIGIGGIYVGEFTWETEEGDVGEHDLKVGSDNQEEEFTVTTLKDAFFEVDILDHDAEVKKDETVVVEYQITNIGDVEGTQLIEFWVEGEVKDTEDITVDGGEDHTAEFSWLAGDAGDYELTIISLDDEDKATVTVTVEEDDGIPGFTLPLSLIAMIIGVILYYKEKRE